MTHPPATAFVHSLTADLAARSAADDRLAPFLEGLRALDCDAVRAAETPSDEPPALCHLPSALRSASGAKALVSAARAVARDVRWYQVFDGAGIDPPLAQGLLAAQVVGPVGLIPDTVLRCGLFLLAPGVHYPHHTHAATEIYYCLSGGLKLTYGLDAGSYLLQPGGLAVTPPHRLHSLTTQDAPVLLIYVWAGDVDAPNWWWDRDEAGTWHRTKWTRAPDASWRQSEREKVSEADLRNALAP